MNSKILLIGVAGISALFGSGLASAESMVRTVSGSFSSTAFDGTYNQQITVFAGPALVSTYIPFDSTLGTLQSVDVAWSVHINVNATTGPDGGDYGGGSGGGFSINSSGYTGAGLSTSGGDRAGGKPVSSSDGFNDPYSFFVADAGKSYDPAILAAFTGSSPFNVSYGLNSFILTADAITSGSAALVYSSSVTYNYTPAVPEPETYALMLAGLGALGFAARRRTTR